MATAFDPTKFTLYPDTPLFVGGIDTAQPDRIELTFGSKWSRTPVKGVYVVFGRVPGVKGVFPFTLIPANDDLAFYGQYDSIEEFKSGFKALRHVANAQYHERDERCKYWGVQCLKILDEYLKDLEA